MAGPTILNDPDSEERFSFSAGFRSASRAFFTSVTLLQDFRVILPVLLYLLLQLLLVAAYVNSRVEPWTTFWAVFARGISSEALGHFPGHLILMQPILGRVEIFLDAFIHIIFQSVTVSLIAAAFRKKSISIGAGFRLAGSRYFRLVGISVISSGAVFALVNIARHLSTGFDGLTRIAINGSGVVAALLIQVLFLYAITLIIYKDRPFWKVIPGSVRFALRFPIPSLLIVLIPFIVTLPTTFLSLKAEMIALQLAPDFMIHSMIATLVMEFIATYLITAGAVIFYIHRTTEVHGSSSTEGKR
ncbi:MAG: hypothetical protein KAV42_04235 [Candidatus Krumholzibacteria bacterium]|nr:hypothetical protein [Candidatus Krumholzibacteria bacterium]